MKIFFIGALSLMGCKCIAQKCGASFTIQSGYPTGTFKSVKEGPIGGGRMSFICRPFWQFPFYTGFELGYQRSIGTTSNFEGARLGINNVYKAKTSYRIATALVNARISIANEKAFLRPFVEALVGANNFSCVINVRKPTSNGFKKVDNTNSSRLGWALTYGGSAGLNVKLNQRSTCYLQLKASYLFGSKARYLSYPTINPDDTVTFSVQKSQTNMFIPQAGLFFNFN